MEGHRKVIIDFLKLEAQKANYILRLRCPLCDNLINPGFSTMVGAIISLAYPSLPQPPQALTYGFFEYGFQGSEGHLLSVILRERLAVDL